DDCPLHRGHVWNARHRHDDRGVPRWRDDRGGDQADVGAERGGVRHAAARVGTREYKGVRERRDRVVHATRGRRPAMESQAMTAMTLLLGITLLQWLVVVAISFFKRMPKVLVASTIILAIGYVNAFGIRHDSVVKAAALPQNAVNCALVEPGMTAEVVRAKLGAPRETRDDGRTRGPCAAIWIYRD